MGAVAASAMWSTANNPLRSCITIVRHLFAAFGVRIQVPMKSITDIGNYHVSTHFGTYEYEKDVGTNKEKVEYRVSDLAEVIAGDIEIVIESEIKEDKNILPKYGYGSKIRNCSIGCDVVAGSNHGQGASRCIAKINLTSPNHMRLAGNCWRPASFICAYIMQEGCTAHIIFVI